MADFARTVFTSRHHPDGAPSALVYGQALIRPLGACMIPVMLGATASVLQQLPVMPYLTWGMPGALIVAVGWTRFRLGATPAEVHIRTGQAAIRSVNDCLWTPSPLIWEEIHDIRQGSDALYLTLGWETHTLNYADWPDHRNLLDALQSARHPASSTA